jgi:uroporphyrinogen-III synthase
MTILYLGTDPSSYQHLDGLVHYPVIKTVPLEIPPHLWDDFPDYSHILFTSKNSAAIFLDALKKTPWTLEELKKKTLVAVGRSTAAALAASGCAPQLVAEQEMQEGVIEILQSQELTGAYIFYPRSTLARKNLENFLIEHEIRHQVCDLYETVFQKPGPLPDLSEFQEIIFTSPSTVKGFLALFGALPRDKTLTCIGPITEAELKSAL